MLILIQHMRSLSLEARSVFDAQHNQVTNCRRKKSLKEKVGESFCITLASSSPWLRMHQCKRKQTTICFAVSLHSLKWGRETEMTLGETDCPLATCTKEIRMYCWCSPLLQTMARSIDRGSHRCTGHLHHREGGGWWICKDFHRAAARTDPEGSCLFVQSLARKLTLIFNSLLRLCAFDSFLTASIRTCPNVYVPCQFWLSFCVRCFFALCKWV